MNPSVVFSSLLPIISVIFCLLYGKKNAVFSSLVGLGVTGFLIISIDSYTVTGKQLLDIATSTFILSLSAIIVIIPGLYLNSVISKQKTIDNMTAWIEKIPLKPENKALILLLGFLPAVESLTGFGVSLFLGVPIFLKLFPQKKALKLSVLGMNIMPWGTLALATIIGSTLIQQPLKKLGTITSLTSFIVFPYIALVSLHVIGGFKALRRFAILALFLGLALSSLLA